MKTICYFSSYFESNHIPYYVRYYLEELNRHCSRVILITNEKNLDGESHLFLEKSKTELLSVKNEGFDFGMWAKGIDSYSPQGYEQLILANDSCVLFRRLNLVLEKVQAGGWDYAGLLDSNEIAYHIQSYMLVVKKTAFQALSAFLIKEPLAKDMTDAIQRFEVGLSQYMLSKGLRIGAVYVQQGTAIQNPVYSHITELLQNGFPLIKRKVIFDSFSFRERISLIRSGIQLYPQTLITQVRQLVDAGEETFDVDQLEGDIRTWDVGKRRGEGLLLNIYRFLRTFRK